MTLSRFATFLWVVILGISTANAQNSSSNDSSIPYKWDASIDVYALLRSGTGNTLLRYAPNPDKFAYRLNVTGLSFGHWKTQDPNSTGTRNGGSFGIEASLGIECRKTFDRFQLYTGPSIYFSTQLSKNSIEDQSGQTTEFSNNTFTIGPEAISGIRYFVLPRLALSAESAFRMTYHSQPVSFGNNDVRSKEFNGRFIPLKAIHVSFFF